jgi:outer membrane protein assembly factor BamB
MNYSRPETKFCDYAALPKGHSDAVTSPTLAPDGTLYIATSDNTLYAVQTTSKGLLNSAWPKYQRDLWNSGSSF